MLPQSLPDFLDQLKANPHVIGLIRFGHSEQLHSPSTGDYDLFVVLRELDSDAQSLHFCINNLPIDLNFISLTELQHLSPKDSFHWTSLRDGEIIYDPSGLVALAYKQLRQQSLKIPPLSEHAIATMRHWHQHMLDKVNGRTDSQPAFCQYVLASNLVQLIKSFFRIRALPFRGETRAFRYLHEQEPDISATLTTYFATTNLIQQIELQIQLADQILAPIGGLWRHNEVLAFGSDTSTNLQVQGLEMLKLLFDSNTER